MYSFCINFLIFYLLNLISQNNMQGMIIKIMLILDNIYVNF